MAARNAAGAGIARLESLLQMNRQALADGDTTRGCDLNQQFHFTLAEIAQMSFLKGILYRIWLQMGPLISAVYAEGGNNMIDCHPPVIDALRQRDGTAAAKAIREDIVSGGQAIRRYLEMCERQPKQSPST